MNKVIQPLSEEFLYGSPERITSALFRLRISIRGKDAMLINNKLRGEVRHAKNKKR